MAAPQKSYRSALIIIQSILEELMKSGHEGMVKTNIYKNVGLKTAVGEKYMEQLEAAEYLSITEELWGKERFRLRVQITPKGRKRFEWFIQLSNELEM